MAPDAGQAGAESPHSLPVRPPAAPVRQILRDHAHDLVGDLFHSINLARGNAEAAVAEGDREVAALSIRVYNYAANSAIGYIVPKNVHVGVTIKNQEDLPDWNAMTPGQQASMTAYLDEQDRVRASARLALPEARRVE